MKVPDTGNTDVEAQVRFLETEQLKEQNKSLSAHNSVLLQEVSSLKGICDKQKNSLDRYLLIIENLSEALSKQ
jgi:hypothetical protein